MRKFTKDEIKQGLDAAYKKAGRNAYFGNGFEAGVKFVLDDLNGEIRESGEEFCDCPQPHTVSTTSGGTKCSLCGKWLFKQ